MTSVHEYVWFGVGLAVSTGVALAMTTTGVIVTRLVGRSPYLPATADR